MISVKTVLTWLPQLAVNAIPGALHQWQAARDLEESLETLPVFNPYRSPRYWLLRVFFFAAPTLLFWFVIPTVFQIDSPSLGRDWQDPFLIGLAIAFGILYTFFLNAPLSLVSLGVLDSVRIDEFVINPVRQSILSSQRKPTNEFWADVGRNLRSVAIAAKRQNYQTGYLHLRDGWSRLFSQTSAEKQKTFTRKLKSIQPGPLRGDLDQKTLELLQELVRDRIISRTELPSILRAFGCEQSAQKYFPNAKR